MNHHREHVKESYSRIRCLKYPEPLFGDLGPHVNKNAQLHVLHKAFRYLMKLYHPDMYSDDLEKYYANELCISISSLKEIAKQKIEKGTYGQKDDISDIDTDECIITTATRQYRVLKHLVEGSFADILLGEYVGPDGLVKKVVIKIIAEAEDNDLLNHEIRFYKKFADFSVPDVVPQYVDSFVMPETRQHAIILSYVDGYDLTRVKERYPQGVTDRHMCWIFDRLLSVLGLLHAHKILHGNVEPENIIIQAHPYPHRGFLIDFLHCLISPDSTDRMTVVRREYTAPEVLRGAKPHPVSELYALGKSMVYLLGGDVKTDELPNNIDPRIAAFLRRFLIKDQTRRAHDAWKMNAELQDLRQRVFGAKHEGLALYM